MAERVNMRGGGAGVRGAASAGASAGAGGSDDGDSVRNDVTFLGGHPAESSVDNNDDNADEEDDEDDEDDGDEAGVVWIMHSRPTLSRRARVRASV